jgi:hypothetical protein
MFLLTNIDGNSWQDVSGKNIVTRPVFDGGKTIVNENDRYFDTILKNCGYTTLVIHSTQNDKVNNILEIPVLVYYTTIDVGWGYKQSTYSGSQTGNNFKSRIDTSKNAIFIANGETLTVYPTVNNSKYPGNDLLLNTFGDTDGGRNDWATVKTFIAYSGDFEDSFGTSVITYNSVDVNVSNNYNGRDEAINGINLSGCLDSDKRKSNSTLKDITYLGTIKISYTHYTGVNYTGKRSTFYKTFLVYYERYI